MMPFLVLPRPILACSSRQPLCFHILAASLSSPKKSTLLESNKSRLFFQNAGGWGYRKNRSFGINNIQTLFAATACNSVPNSESLSVSRRLYDNSIPRHSGFQQLRLLLQCGAIAMCNFCGVCCVLVYGCAETRADERAGKDRAYGGDRSGTDRGCRCLGGAVPGICIRDFPLLPAGSADPGRRRRRHHGYL